MWATNHSGKRFDDTPPTHFFFINNNNNNSNNNNNNNRQFESAFLKKGLPNTQLAYLQDIGRVRTPP